MYEGGDISIQIPPHENITENNDVTQYNKGNENNVYVKWHGQNYITFPKAKPKDIYDLEG